MITDSIAYDTTPHISWSIDQSKLLTDQARQYLIQHQTEYVSHTVETYTHPATQIHELYDKIVTVGIGSGNRKNKIWYACRPSNELQLCRHTSIHRTQKEFANHMSNQHRINMACLNCDRLIHPTAYKKHYTACCKQYDDIAGARKKQIIEMENSPVNSDSDNDDTDLPQAEINAIEDSLVTEDDDYTPMYRNRTVGVCTYSNPLIRIESLQFYDITRPVQTDAMYPTQFAEWTPTRCEKYTEQCKIVMHGTFLRFCYDTDEPFLLEIRRYKCTTHYNIIKGKRASTTFHMLHPCVDRQMAELKTIRKTQDVMAFDTVLITANLYTRIANISLITMNDSHCNRIIKHDYRRRWSRKSAAHQDYVLHLNFNLTEDENHNKIHTCTAQHCYGLTMRHAAGYMTLYGQMSERALDIATTRAIYQRHIVPLAVLPKATALQHHIITQHCSNAISMDHTFKMAKFGIFNMQNVPKPESINAPANEVVNFTSTTTAIPVSNVNTEMVTVPATSSPNQVTTPINKRKRKYNKLVEYTKLTAQLLTVMDSNNLALQCYIVPNGKATLLSRMLELLISKQRATSGEVRINTVSVDNASQVAHTLMHHYTESTGKPLTVLQDLWHARERIEREFNSDHPNIKDARQEWRNLIADVVMARCSRDTWKTNMIAFRDKYTKPIKYSAVGPMAQIALLAARLIANDREYRDKVVLDADELVEQYCRKHPQDIDDSNKVNYPVLRKPGETALNNLIHDNNIAYVFDRTKNDCINSKGTTPNEALHRVFNGRLSRFGGIRTFASAQQAILIIQYQYNSQKLFNRGQYWCEINIPGFSTIRHSYVDPLGEPDRNVLQRLEVDWSKMQWQSKHDTALDRLIVDLATGSKHCHTKHLPYWLSTQPEMDGIAPKLIEKKLNAKLAQIPKQVVPTVVPVEVVG